jgi:hypothetical protein
MPSRTVATTRDEVRAKLLIDDDDLDGCFVEQPEYFFQAAEAFTIANSGVDTLKLELKELTAELDQEIRRFAVETGEKLSETLISNRILLTPRIKQLNRKLLEAKRVADDWDSLKEAFIQRSYALKDLNSSQLARLNNLAMEQGSTGPRRNVGDAVRSQQEQLRRERRTQPRYQPRDGG